MANEKILIVDDEANTRALLTKDLEGAGYQIFPAEDGDSGYQIAKGIKPDLIISDILMPQMDGNEFMKKIRESEFGKNIPFIILSARSQMQDYFEMMEADDFITKPFKSDDLLMRVDRVLAKIRKAKKETEEQKLKAQGKTKVLILDNENQDYEKFKKILMDNKFEVEISTTLTDCLETAVSFRPHLVVLRFLMDRMNGDKIIKTLKEISSIRNVPYIVYSRKFRGWEEKKILDAGGTCFIGEVTEEKLLKAAQQAVEKS